ncbi:D-glycero-beta-D-manno-heptose 1,7-bisphosphate 7-phosphatase [Clostridium felsineum]|uniref:D-glycero-beta-D-manno-heptose 1,7-bisphosphate 7-phosphatase n=1 Tax=Clostridium felsineum TaxID=36839 RepID=UPI00098BE9A9|nr:D-glycero-beta-D-manno-heptose 1,7-bisphosphate 7-phosphatase [Clostridium felsineum]URZ03564.1 D-glycero-beta-D-manno-heptose-1,7-bisphosphate 7-phosphatase [Clostridium felsineum]
MNKAVFIDRDGTINVEKNYLYKIEDFEFIEGTREAIKILNDNGYKVVVITNQAGVARGYYTEEDVKKLHEFIQEELKKCDAHVDAFYYCPHHPIDGKGKYKTDCDCRKPKDGLYKKAIQDINIDVEKSYAVGDKISDLLPALSNKIEAFLVMTGYGQKERNIREEINIIQNLYSFVTEIVKDKRDD